MFGGREGKRRRRGERSGAGHGGDLFIKYRIAGVLNWVFELVKKANF